MVETRTQREKREAEEEAIKQDVLKDQENQRVKKGEGSSRRKTVRFASSRSLNIVHIIEGRHQAQGKPAKDKPEGINGQKSQRLSRAKN